MLRSPSTRGQVNNSVAVSPVSGKAAGSSSTGAIGPKSTISARLPPGGMTTMKPMPPRPLFHGSRTASAKAVATPASTALPPAARISAPTRAATPFCDATSPPREAATGLRTIQFCTSPGCAASAMSPYLDRVDAGLVERVMPGHPRRLVIRRTVSPDGVDGLFPTLGTLGRDRPIRAVALERAIALVVGRVQQFEPHVFLRDVMDRLVPGLLA